MMHRFAKRYFDETKVIFIAMKIFDGHNDVLSKLYALGPGSEGEFFKPGADRHIDLSRAGKGNFGGGFFAIFVSPHPSTEWWSMEKALTFTEDGYRVRMPPALNLGYAQQTAMGMMALLFRIEDESNGQVKIVRSFSELKECLESGVLAAVMHFEGAEPVDENFEALEVFYQAGLRSVGITWSRPNIFGRGVPMRFPSTPDHGPGLTEAGRRLVKACNRMGIVVDCAHLNEKGFFDVAKITDKPLVVTHSAAHALTPSARNLTDRQLDALGESGGIVGVNFFVGDLRPDGKFETDTPLEMIVRHISYVAERIGIDHVAFGSDFDGAYISDELKDVAGLPKLIKCLREEGFGKEDVEKIARRNWLRILKNTWRK